jgi:hypothetical protein
VRRVRKRNHGHDGWGAGPEASLLLAGLQPTRLPPTACGRGQRPPARPAASATGWPPKLRRAASATGPDPRIACGPLRPAPRFLLGTAPTRSPSYPRSPLHPPGLPSHAG